MTAHTITDNAPAPVASNGKPPESFATLVKREVIKALRDSNKAQYNATVSVALWLAEKQVESAGTDHGIDVKRQKGHFRMFLKALAASGEEVFRDTQHLINAVMAQPKGDKRNKAASEYVDKECKGLKLTDALGRLRTYAFRLMDDVHANHAGILRELAQAQKDGFSAELLRDKWLAFVGANYGDSFNRLTETLSKPASERAKPDAVDSIAKRAADMSDADLVRLLAKLQAIAAERANALAEAQAMIEGDDDAEGDDESETVETIAAAA